MQVKWFLAGAMGCCVYGGSVYATMILVRGSAPKPMDPAERSPCPVCSARRPHQFDDLATVYDSKVGWDEFFMGIGLLRWRMVGNAQGRVLETSAGTGRNIGYYPEGVNEVVFTDLNEQMLRQAKGKWESTLQDRYQHRATFIVSDAEALTEEALIARESGKRPTRWAIFHRLKSIFSRERSLKKSEEETSDDVAVADVVSLHSTNDIKTAVLAPGLQYTFPEDSFDCCVDTFGLCSCNDPVQALVEMSRVVKPTGQVILLEHGRSYWTFLNNVLDSDAVRPPTYVAQALHFKKWGCWWNRDILEAVEQAGLQIDSISRWHFGTTYALVCSKQNTDSDPVEVS